jgi:hypothetical protein
MGQGRTGQLCAFVFDSFSAAITTSKYLIYDEHSLSRLLNDLELIKLIWMPLMFIARADGYSLNL